MNQQAFSVFQYWDTGIEGMPEVIRYIYEHNLSLSRHYNFELILMTQNNVHQYINPMAGFFNLASNFQSDICRFLALDKYGGIWLDSDAIILKDLNPVFSKFQASRFEMMLDSEYNKTIGCASIFTKANTVCSSYCVQYLHQQRWKMLVSPVKPALKWLKSAFFKQAGLKLYYLCCQSLKIPYKLRLLAWRPLQWGDLGPRNVAAVFAKYEDKIQFNTYQQTRLGCNFIHWSNGDNNTARWLLDEPEQALEKAKMIFNNTAYALIWTTYRDNNFKTSTLKMIFKNENSVFCHLIKLSQIKDNY